MSSNATLLSNQTITANGSTLFRGSVGQEAIIYWSIASVSGTTPAIQFTMTEMDPGLEVAALSDSVTSSPIIAAGADSLSLPHLDSPTIQVSWTVSGAGATFTGVTLVAVARLVSNELAVGGQSSFAPDPSSIGIGAQSLQSDVRSALQVRGLVLTDEGSYRDDFAGSSLYTTLTGTYRFTNGSTVVTGTGTLFTSETDTTDHIRLSAHADSALTRIGVVESDTRLLLADPYTGATGSGAATKTHWLISTPAGASFSVSGSVVTMTANTTNGNMTRLARDGDYLPVAMTAVFSLSQRIANQEIFVGFWDDPSTPEASSGFFFDGTDATKVICRTAFSSNSVQSTTVTLPSSGSTSTPNIYLVEQNSDRATFYINGIQVAIHQTHLPGQYVPMFQVASIKNTGTAGSATSMALDTISFVNRDMVTIESPIAIQGTAGGVPITIQFGNPGGGTALPKLINITYNKSDGAIVANAYKRVATYTSPAAFNGYLIKYVSFQNEAAVSRVVAETNMGQHNDNTNVFTAGAAYTSPQWVPTVQAEVTTAYAAGSGNVVLTVGYTNDAGTAGRSGTITIPKGSLIGSRWDLVLQGTDLGAMSIQSCTGTPTQVGISKILGLLQLALHQDQSTTAQTETLYAPGAITFPPGTVIGLEYAGGTVNKQRIIDVLIQLVQ